MEYKRKIAKVLIIVIAKKIIKISYAKFNSIDSLFFVVVLSLYNVMEHFGH